MLQDLIDHRVIRAADTDDLECVGAVFGMRVLDAADGLAWAVVEDDRERALALRYLATDLLLFPLTAIAERVEAGQPVCVLDVFRWFIERVPRFARSPEGLH